MSTQLSPFNPVVTQQYFAESAGLSLRVVEGWVIRGYLPTIKIGKHRLVNVAALVAQTDQPFDGAHQAQSQSAS